MNYYIADTHFGCTNRFEGRTLDHDKIIKDNWNSVVTNADDVYILGDVGRCGNNKEKEYLCEILSTLKGKKKILITGNHDDLRDIRVKNLFQEIHDIQTVYDQYKGKMYRIILSHYPIYTWDGAYKGYLHFYGHVHNNFDERSYQKAMKELREEVEIHNTEEDAKLKVPHAFNVGCMKYGYRPVTLSDIFKEYGFIDGVV